MTKTSEPIINERAQHLLKVLVERYIRDGQPVGSRTLAEETALGLSSATIRNVLADLEDHGYLRSPHTSAGRVPTAKGYRLFVDSLLTMQPLDQTALVQFKQQLKLDQNVSELAATASNLLSDVTRMAGLVMLPKRERLLLRHVEFLPLSENRVLVILVFNEHEVQNRVIYTDRIYSPSELQQAANYLTAIYAGQNISQIRQQLLNAMQTDREDISHLMQTAIEVANKALTKPASSDQDYVLAGQSHLLELADEGGVMRLRQIFEAFTQKRDILHLLDQCLSAEGLQIYIGEESGYAALDECSIVTAPYSLQGKTVGVLGVIGPTRMSYDRIIPIVDVTAKLLSAALNHMCLSPDKGNSSSLTKNEGASNE
jgi:heat-inducible transcriptional repressor